MFLRIGVFMMHDGNTGQKLFRYSCTVLVSACIVMRQARPPPIRWRGHFKAELRTARRLKIQGRLRVRATRRRMRVGWLRRHMQSWTELLETPAKHLSLSLQTRDDRAIRYGRRSS